MVLLLKIGRCYEAEICHYARLEVCYRLVLFFAKVKIFRFWPKTMDYSPWFFFWESKKVLRKVYHLKVIEKRSLVALVSVA